MSEQSANEDNRTAMDSQFAAAESAELHAKLIEARDALMADHEARAALLVEEAIDQCGDLTGEIDKL